MAREPEDRGFVLLGIKYEAAALGGMDESGLARIEEQIRAEAGDSWATHPMVVRGRNAIRAEHNLAPLGALPRELRNGAEPSGRPLWRRLLGKQQKGNVVLYRNFAMQEELDAQYDLENIVEDISLYTDFYVKESEKVRAEFEHRPGVPFGPTLAKHLALYPAPGTEHSSPILVYLHGGSGARGRGRSSASSPVAQLRGAWRPSSTTPSAPR